MLKQAITDYLEGTQPEGKIDEEKMDAMESAKYWFFNQDNEHPEYVLSLCSVCAMLGIDKQEVLQKLEERVNARKLKKQLRKAGVINGSVELSYKDLLEVAARHLEKTLKKFGHDVQVDVSISLNVNCSDDKLNKLCESLLGTAL